MRKEHLLTALFLIFAYLFYRLLIPFLAPIAWAGIFVIVFYPMFRWLYKRMKSKGWASFVSCILIFVVIIGPVAYLMVLLVSEAGVAVQKLNAAYQDGSLKKLVSPGFPFIDTIKNRLAAYPQLAGVDFGSIIKDAVTTITKAIGAQATTVIANITRTLFQFLLMMFTMFYFFRDGDRIVKFMKRITPIEQDKVEVVYLHLKGVVEGMMYGGVVVALLQGFLGGLLFAIMGISSPVFWGAVMALMAFVPILGPYLIYIPAGIILMIEGSFVKGILLIVIGSIVVSQIDNFVRPHLFHGKTQTHTLMLFFSILGGIILFGLPGIVLGPFIAAIFTSFLKMIEIQLHPEDNFSSILITHNDVGSSPDDNE